MTEIRARIKGPSLVANHIPPTVVPSSPALAATGLMTKRLHRNDYTDVRKCCPGVVETFHPFV